MTDEKPKDVQLAAQYKAEMLFALQHVAAIMDRAKAEGLTCSWQGIGIAQTGKHEPVGITVARYY